MRVRRRQSSQSFIEVDDNFATLIDIEQDGTYVYEFQFKAAVVKAARSGISSVEVEVNKTIPLLEPPVIPTIDSPIGTVKASKDILTFDSRRKDVARRNKALVLYKTNVDITATFDNTKSSSLSNDDIPDSNLTKQQRVIDLQTVGSLIGKNFDPPISQTNARANRNPINAQRSSQAPSFSMIRRNVDPSSFGQKKSTIQGTYDAIAGTLKIENPPGRQALGSTETKFEKDRDSILTTYTKTSRSTVNARVDLPAGNLVPVIKKIPRLLVPRTKIIRLRSDQIGFDDFYVTFTIVDASGQRLQRVTKRVQHTILVRIFSMPTVAPTIAIAPFQFPGKNVIEISQNDPRAELVRIEKRTLKKVDTSIIDNAYKLVAEIPLTKDNGVTKFVDITNNFSQIQYRCIPIGRNGSIGFSFSNAISPAISQGDSDVEISRRLTYASLDVGDIEGGVEIVVNSIPPGIISVAILRRNLTLNETEFKIISDDDRPIRLVNGGLSRARFLDTYVKEENIYEYGCLLYYEDGVSIKSSASVIHEHIATEVGQAIISISNLRVDTTSAQVDARFNVISELRQNNLDVVKQALTSQGLDDIFISELTADRDKLQKLIAHKIDRTNLSTGERETFGVFSGSDFSDIREGAKQGVKPLKPGQQYRYVISTLLRDADSMFESFKKTKTDQTIGKEYTFLPFKFNHPLSLNKGTIVTRESLASNHPRDDFSFGQVGNPVTVDISVDVSDPRVVNLSVSRLDRSKSSLRWSINGLSSRVEHFVIVKNILGMKTVAGKVHHVSLTGDYEFFDDLEPNDIGEISYQVIPVFNNFIAGSASSPQTLVIRDRRIIAGVESNV